MARYRMAHEASICMTVEADSEEQARALVKEAMTGIVDYQTVFVAQIDGQPDPDAVLYLVDAAQPTVEDIEEED